MSVFNYKTRQDPLEGLRSRVGKLEKLLKALKFWEVNDVALGENKLRRRKVTPTLTTGAVGHGPWFDVNITGGGGTTSTNYSDFAFGFTRTGAVVTVKAGKVRHGTRTPVSVAGSAITIAADQTYIYVAYTYSGAAVLASSTVEPVDTEGVHNHVLHLWSMSAGGTVSLAAGGIKHLGDIFIPGSFA